MSQYFSSPYGLHSTITTFLLFLCPNLSSVLLSIGGNIVWIYSATIANSKIRKCCRSKVYKLAEKHLAKIRVGSSDGISYDGVSLDLKISVVFKDKRDSEKFQTEMGEIPLQYRRCKPDGNSAVADISVKDQIFSAVHVEELARIRSSEYARIESDENPSADCDALSDVPLSYVSAVELTEDVKLRLLDNPNSAMLRTQKPVKCHLKSQTRYPEDKSNTNNILFMSSFLHLGFEGINQYAGVPDFALRFESCNASASRCLVGEEKHYEAKIRVVFPREGIRVVYTPFFKDSTRIEGLEEIELNVYVDSPKEFRNFLDHKYQNTLLKWASLVGPVGEATCYSLL